MKDLFGIAQCLKAVIKVIGHLLTELNVVHGATTSSHSFQTCLGYLSIYPPTRLFKYPDEVSQAQSVSASPDLTQSIIHISRIHNFFSQFGPLLIIGKCPVYIFLHHSYDILENTITVTLAPISPIGLVKHLDTALQSDM